MAGLSRDIGVSFDSVRNWIELFEDFFMVFRIAPWTRKIFRAITKEKKLYLFDRKFQNILNIPAVQLVNRDGICKVISNNSSKMLIISADHWLSLLP